MKISHISIITIILVVIAVAIAGCSSTSPTSPAAGTTPTSGSAATTSVPGISGGATGGSVSGAQLFGGLSYNWVEYKMSAGSGADAMTIYYKYNKQTGKCSMRFEGAQQVQGMPTEMDCSSSGTGKSTNDPNQVGSDAQVSCSPIDELVTVPAGTFTATKCTITTKEGISTTWVVKDKFMVKMQSNTGQDSVEMVLNNYG